MWGPMRNAPRRCEIEHASAELMIVTRIDDHTPTLRQETAMSETLDQMGHSFAKTTDTLRDFNLKMIDMMRANG